MADVESAEEFAKRIRDGALDGTWPVEHAEPWAWYLSELQTRDAAIRAAARREAFEEAAEWCAEKVADVREVTYGCRKEAIALKDAGKDWSEAFQRECLSDSRRGAFTDAEEHFRALAANGEGER